MKLVDLKPRWFSVDGASGDRDGFSFECPCSSCRTGPTPVRLGVQLASAQKPLMTFKEKYHHVHTLGTFDVPPGHLWHSEGGSFESMTLSPSVDASASGHWHGFVRNGEVA